MLSSNSKSLFCKLQSAMEYVFGSTFVCKSIDAAKEVCPFLALHSSKSLFEQLDSSHGCCSCFGDGIYHIFYLVICLWTFFSHAVTNCAFVLKYLSV